VTGPTPHERLTLMVYPKTTFTSLDYFIEVLRLHPRHIGFFMDCEELVVGSAPAILVEISAEQGTSRTPYFEAGDLIFELNTTARPGVVDLVGVAEGLYPTYRATGDPTGGRPAMLGTWYTDYAKPPQVAFDGRRIASNENWSFDSQGNLFIRSSLAGGDFRTADPSGALEQAYLQYWAIGDWLYLFGGDIWMVLPVEQSGDTLTVGHIVLWREPAIAD